MKAPSQIFIKNLYISEWGGEKNHSFLSKGKSLTLNILLFTPVFILHIKIFTLKCVSFQKQLVTPFFN